MRYFLLDKVTSLDAGRVATGVKCVSYADEVLHDHFPDHPIFPGALLTEGLAQLAGFLLESSANRDESVPVRRALMASIDKMKFYKPCEPGDQIRLRAEVESWIGDSARVLVEAAVDGETCAKGKLTFSLRHVASARISAQRQEVYAVWTRGLPECPPLR